MIKNKNYDFSAVHTPYKKVPKNEKPLFATPYLKDYTRPSCRIIINFIIFQQTLLKHMAQVLIEV